MYQIIFMTQAQKDAKKIASSGLKPFEYLKGDMKGLISRRINKQHRLVYEVFEGEKIIKVYRMWTHYE